MRTAAARVLAFFFLAPAAFAQDWEWVSESFLRPRDASASLPDPPQTCQRIRLVAGLDFGWPYGGGDEVLVRYPGGEFRLAGDSIAEVDWIHDPSAGTPVSVSLDWDLANGGSADPYLVLDWYLERPSNIDACLPSMDSYGAFRYGYDLDTPSLVNPCGTHPRVELWFAEPVDGGWQGTLVDSRPIEASGGEYCETFEKSGPFHGVAPEFEYVLTRINRGAPPVADSDESDDIAAMRLPLCRLTGLDLGSARTARISFEIENLHPIVEQIPIELYYATGPEVADILPGGPLFTRYPELTSEATDSGLLTASITSERLPRPPEGATHLIATINRSAMLPQVGDGPHFLARELIELDLFGLRWDGKGGAEFRFTATGELPAGIQLYYRMAWVVSDGTNERLVPVDRRKKTVDLDLSSQGQRINSSRLKLPKNPAHLYGVTHLEVFVSDRDGLVKLPGMNRRRLALPHTSNGRLSYELADAPPAGTPEQRVKLWMRLKKHERKILEAATRFNIDPRAIAAAIAWEALENIKPFTNSYLAGYQWCGDPRWEKRPLLGPGKVHWINEQNPFAESAASEVEALGYLPAQDFCARWELLLTADGAIDYIAAIMNGFATPWDPYFNIRCDPILLCKYYNGDISADRDSIGELTALLAASPPTAPPVATPYGPMTQWVADNTQQFDEEVLGYVEGLLKATRRGSPCVGPPPVMNYADVTLLYQTFIAPEVVSTQTLPDPFPDFDLDPGLFAHEFYAGDKRWFSRVLEPDRSRSYHQITLSLDPTRMNPVLAETKGFGITRGYDDDGFDGSGGGSDVSPCTDPFSGSYGQFCLKDTAMPECEDRAVAGRGWNVLNMSVIDQAPGELVVMIQLAGGNPCTTNVPFTDVRLVPYIDAFFVVRIRQVLDHGVPGPIYASLSGLHDGFPWHELYLDGVPLYQWNAYAEGHTPWSLFGHPNLWYSSSSVWGTLNNYVQSTPAELALDTFIR